MNKHLPAIILAFCLCLPSPAGTEEQEYVIPDGETIPKPEKIDDDRIRIGKVEVNHRKRTVSFPAFVNMNEGLIEYIVGMPHGKIHETLLLTEADPLHMSVGMQLLKFTSFEKFFPERGENLEWLPYTPPKPEEYDKARVQISLSWDENGKKREARLSELIVNTKTKQGIGNDEWLYTNSYFYDGRYQASLTGDLISIFADRSSPVNFIGEFNKGVNESGWIANPAATPKPDTPVTVTITQLTEPAPQQEGQTT